MKHRITLLLLILSAAPLLAQSQAIYHTRGDAELFVDDLILASTENVERVIRQADKLDQPVLEPAHPWENNRVYIYGTVDRDPQTGRFRMWYNSAGLCYAESDDGIHWTRPSLGLHEYKGSRDNNIVLPDVSNSTVFVDRRETDPARRYKALFGKGRFYLGAYSADGIHWTMYRDGDKLINFGSELVTVNRDAVSGQYLAYIRTQPPKLHPVDVTQKRTCSLTTSSNFVDWSAPELMIQPDEVDDQWIISNDQRTEFYGWNGFACGSQYLGFLTVFRITGTIPDHPKFQSAYDGPIDVQLIHSRDGRTWHRTMPRTAVIPNGPYDYDAGTILHIANNPIEVGDELWLYYTAINTTHGGAFPPKRCTIALAKWPRDRFVSLRAHWAQGRVQTVPLQADGDNLIVNADAARGDLAVEVLDGNGQVWPGYARDDCTAVTTDNLRHRMTWREHDRLPQAGPVALRFIFRNADLYGFSIVKASD
ncbi:MAG: hypothetical protein IT445_07695 [Phycisphaeraceae bacterium]|nr:hypothetical protein [Phycisphaeraceae bacterium]